MVRRQSFPLVLGYLSSAPGMLVLVLMGAMPPL